MVALVTRDEELQTHVEGSVVGHRDLGVELHLSDEQVLAQSDTQVVPQGTLGQGVQGLDVLGLRLETRLV